MDDYRPCLSVGVSFDSRVCSVARVSAQWAWLRLIRLLRLEARRLSW